MIPKYNIVWCVGVVLASLRPAPGLAQVEAYKGEPVGVGRFRVELDTPELRERWQLGALTLSDTDGRVFYCTFDAPGFMYEARRRFARGKKNAAIDVLFLFTGAEPLQIHIPGSDGETADVKPRHQPAQHRRLLRTWWRQFSEIPPEADFSPLPELYLSALLQRRLPDLPPPRELVGDGNARKRDSWSELLDMNSERALAAFARATTGKADRSPAAHLLTPGEPHIFAAAADTMVTTEEACTYIPADSYYIRFGKFSNLLWLLELLEERAGELGRLVTLRGTESPLGGRIQDQLGIRELPFAEYLGDTLIADAALVGYDFYFADGPSIGVLLKARNPMLPAGLVQLRKKVQKEMASQGAKLDTLKHSGQEFSELSTPDNTIRSFHASRDGWHLITNCRHMIERFLELEPGSDETLSRDEMFLQARSLQPATSEAIDVFLGPAFIQQWHRKSAQVESNRRRLAAAELLVAELAELAGSYEADHGHWPTAPTLERDAPSGPTAEIDERMARQLLPTNFGVRSDGSHPVRDGSRWIDSMRGARGAFLPIADVDVERVNDEEQRSISRSSPAIQPAFVRIHRNKSAKAENAEKLAIKAYLFPEPKRGIDWLALFAGSPTNQQLGCDADMWLQCEAVLSGLRMHNDEGNRHLFVGVLDKETAPCNVQLALQNVATLALTAPMFRATWPGPGVLDGALRRRVPEDGVAYRGLLGKWRCQLGDVHLQSHQREVLESVAPTLAPSVTDEPAQIRFVVQDLQTARLSSWLESIAVRRGLQASVNNVRALHELMLRFGITADQAQELAADLYGGELICPLGGTCATTTWPSGGVGFRNSTWNASGTGIDLEATASTVPAVFRWFHGATGHVRFGDNVVEATLSISISNPGS